MLPRSDRFAERSPLEPGSTWFFDVICKWRNQEVFAVLCKRSAWLIENMTVEINVRFAGGFPSDFSNGQYVTNTVDALPAKYCFDIVILDKNRSR